MTFSYPTTTPRANVSRRFQHHSGLFVTQCEDRTVRQRSQPGRAESPIGKFLTENRHLNATVIWRVILSSPGGHGNQHIGIGAQAIGLRERTGRHNADVIAPISG